MMPLRSRPMRSGWPLTAFLALACNPPDSSSAATAPTPVVEAGPQGEVPAGGEAAAQLQRSLELEQQGDLAGARAAADAALAAGGGRDATLQAAKIAILEQRYDDAIGPLEALVQANATDADAQYNLALVLQHKGDYNRSRNGYLAAIRAEPRYAAARYNLAVLCWNHGFADEARHHVAKFRAAFPDDPRGPELERRLGGAGTAGPTGATAEKTSPEAATPSAPPAR